MTIEEKLFAILTGSPLPIPELGTRIYAGTAEQLAVKPYLVYYLDSTAGFPTQDEQAHPDLLRRWRYSFSVVCDGYLEGRDIMQKLRRFLVAYTDRPLAGFNRALEITGRGGWVESERVFQFTSDFDIVENLA